MSSVSSIDDVYTWYVAYGSNLNELRFMCYIQGGTPEGRTVSYVGCTDKTPPLAVRTLTIGHELYFSGVSKVWGGGSAFITHQAGEQQTKARAYLITRQQLEEVIAQESNRVGTRQGISVSLLRECGHHSVAGGRGRYDEVVYHGELEGLPAICLTSPVSQPHDVMPPSAAYLRIIAAGIAETYDMSLPGIADYLMTKRGVVGSYSTTQIMQLLSDDYACEIFAQAQR